VIDSFPYEEWGEEVAGFWTFGPGNSTGTYIMTALGITAFVLSMIAFFVLEGRKLRAQTELLRGAGGFPAAGGVPPGPGPSQEPLAGPTTDPGT
jgi:hypothetical protein